jgi:myo-inositol-1(or 4)-monophosphatase
VQNKSSCSAFDPVTEADRAAETVMRALIRKTFPAHGIIGEEFGEDKPDAAYVWVLDPIDGTKSFIAGMPNWGTLIGLLKEGEPVYGMMHQPFIGERFTGDGAVARYRGPAGERKLSARNCKAVKDAILFTTSPLLMNEEERERFRRVEQAAQLSRYGGDCYAYCMVAAGHIDLVIEAGLNRYDIMPLIPIVEGAGGVVTTWDGGPAKDGGRIIAAGDKRVHEQALALLRNS